jgi:GNAT superfamily N-acetyltransferase
MTVIEIRPARLSDAESTIAMVMRAFDAFVAPDYSAEGIDHFHNEVTAASLECAINDDEIVLVALADADLVGVIKVRDETHISLLFVDELHQARGIGLELITRAVAEIQNRTPDATTITVNSSPFALPVYIHMGFESAGPETETDGMKYFPLRAGIEIFRCFAEGN